MCPRTTAVPSIQPSTETVGVCIAIMGYGTMYLQLRSVALIDATTSHNAGLFHWLGTHGGTKAYHNPADAEAIDITW